MLRFILLFLLWFLFAEPAFAIGSIIATQVLGMAVGAWTTTAVAFAINMVASTIISQLFAPDAPNMGGSNANNMPNPGNRQQISPAGDNRLPVVYGSAWVGGMITDMSISGDNQDIYWVVALSEVTNSENGGTPDAFTFGGIYWGGKRVIFGSNGYSVTGLKDESTSDIQDITGYMDIYLYRNGSNQPANSSQSAISVMSASNLVYKWNSTKLMSNCAFAIVHVKYSQPNALTGLSQTRFQVINPRNAPGDCMSDYLKSKRYGAAIDASYIDSATMTALNTYSNQNFTYTTFSGGTSTQKRFQFNGALDTNLKIMQNIQNMADCCDCLVKYNEITGLWGVIVQTPTVTTAMALDDSNIVSAITVTPIDLSNSFNICEVKFPDGGSKDSFNSATFDLATINPALLYANEPVNKQSLSLYFVNNSITAQYLANRFLEAAREDLQLQLEIGYAGIQLEAGDVVTLTNLNYGWTAKQFRVMKVIEKFNDSGAITASLNLMEFNPAVYDDKNITEFKPVDNSGLGSPTNFGTVPAPTVSGFLPNIASPAFSVNVTASTAGIIQYAEIYYSAYQYPTDTQLIYAGVTTVQPSGDPYLPNASMPATQLFNLPAGDYYFFTRMVNSIAKSAFSPASSLVKWRPTTFQFSKRYLSIAYADSITGAGFSLSPRGKSYYGIFNQDVSTPSSTPSDYKWYLADPSFGTNIYLISLNRTGRLFSFGTDFAAYAAGSGYFVPTSTSKYDPRLWAALDDGINFIDLDYGTGQVTQTGTTTVGTGQVKIINTGTGQIVASLDKFLNFGGAATKTGSAATITIDEYGRVVGFSTPDDFYYTAEYLTATSGQTAFTPTARQTGYIIGQDLIFINGCLLDPSEYTETLTTFTLSVGATVGDVLSIISMRCKSSEKAYKDTSLTVQTVGSNNVVYSAASLPWQLINVGDQLTFSNVGTPTNNIVSSVNYTTRTITFTATITATAGNSIYRHVDNNDSYQAFSRWSFDLTSAGTYTPTTWQFKSGYELVFMNGTIVNEQDYDIVSGAITNFPSTASGKMSVIQFAPNNIGAPVGSPQNVVTFTVNGQSNYSFVYNATSFNLYANGIYLKQATDYTTSSGFYSLVNTPTNSSTVLLQQTFARIGAA